MKKTNIVTILSFAFVLLISMNATAQEFSDLDKSPMDVASFPTDYKDANKLIKISYTHC